MTWKSERPSILRILLESWRFFLPRAPKLMACYLPYYVFGGAALALSVYLERLGVVGTDPDTIGSNEMVFVSFPSTFFTWYLGLAGVSWATVRSLESDDPSLWETLCRPIRHLGTLFLTATLGFVLTSLLFLTILMGDFLGYLGANCLGFVLMNLGLLCIASLTGFLVVRLRLVRTIALVEKARFFDCIKRSNALTKGNSLYVLFLFLIQQAATFGVFFFLAELLMQSAPRPPTPLMKGLMYLLFLFHGINLTLFSGVMDGVLYHHLRRLKEARA